MDYDIDDMVEKCKKIVGGADCHKCSYFGTYGNYSCGPQSTFRNVGPPDQWKTETIDQLKREVALKKFGFLRDPKQKKGG